jgi:Ni,Fe-hydrogenase I large subunit
MEEIYLSAREVGEYIDKPVRTIENWAAAGNVRQNEQGKYGLISAFRYQLESLEVKLARTKLLLEEAQDKASEETKDIKERKLKAEADKEEALARIKNMEADKLEGKLVDAEEVLTAWKNAIANAKAKLINIPAKLAWELSGIDKPEDIQARLAQVIDEALIELGSESRNF